MKVEVYRYDSKTLEIKKAKSPSNCDKEKNTCYIQFSL